jgi:hypothetical protein
LDNSSFINPDISENNNTLNNIESNQLIDNLSNNTNRKFKNTNSSNDHNVTDSDLPKTKFSNIKTSNQNNPNKELKTQYEGLGNPNSIKVNESVTLLKTESLDTSNTFSNPNNSDIFQVPALNEYTILNGIYSIDNITTSFNHETIEDSSVFDTLSSKNEGDTRSISTSFTVNVSMINITQLQIAYTTAGNVVLQDSMAYITGISNGLPNETVIGEILNFGKQSNPVTLTYLNPVTLPKGSYALVLNDTGYTGAQAYFDWHIAWDNTTINGDGVNESQMWTKNATGNWINQSADLLFKYEYIEINPDNMSLLKMFTSPLEVDLKYNSTLIQNFYNNPLWINGSLAYFSSNTSVSFDIHYLIRFRLNLNMSLEFFVTNKTLPIWNVTVNQNMIFNNNYQIVNRTIQFNELPIDWNATFIYLNGSLFSDNLIVNENVTYNYQSSILLLNLTTNTSALEWVIQFVSPNYLQEITLLDETMDEINYPYQVNSANTLNIDTLFFDSSGQNGSLMVYDFNKNLNFSSINNPVIDNTLSFEWVINSTLDFSQMVNGSYTIVIFWKDDINLKIGYLEIDIILFIQTKLIVNPINEVFVGENINLTVKYSSFHNQMNLNNANVNYITSWDLTSPTQINQTEIYGDYIATNITTNGTVEGPVNITISASLPGHINHTYVLFFNLIINTSLFYTTNTNTPYYQDFILLNIQYQNKTRQNIFDGTVTVNGSIANPSQSGDGSYIFTFQASVVDPNNQSFFLIITANKSYHEFRQLVFQYKTLAIPTKEINLTFTQGIIDPQENISKLGYTLGLELIWNRNLSNNQSLIHEPNIEIFRNNESINASLDNITNNDWSIKLTLDFNRNKGYKRGFYTFLMNLSKYGVENKSISFTIFIEGFDLSLDLTYSGTLIQGAEYSITANVTFTNGTINSNANILRKFKELNRISDLSSLTQIGDPVEDVFVDFEVSIDFVNGTTRLLKETIETGISGIAIFLISSSVTKDIEKINSISVNLAEFEYSEPFQRVIIPNIEIQQTQILLSGNGLISNNDLFLLSIILISAVIITMVSSFVLIFIRKQKRAKASIFMLIDEKLSLVSDIYTILVTTQTGLPIYSVMNSLFKRSKKANDLISSLSVAIDSFIDSFHGDFMAELSGKDKISSNVRTDKSNIKLSTIQRDQFQILIAASYSYRLFVFMKEKPTKSTEELFFNAIIDIERSIKVEEGKLIEEDVINSKVNSVLKLHFPTILLERFTIDLNRLISLDKEVKNGGSILISRPTINALKRLILLRGGHASTSDSSQSQVKQFNSLVSQRKITEVGLLHYDVLLKFLKETLNVSHAVLEELIWNKAFNELKLFIPYQKLE